MAGVIKSYKISLIRTLFIAVNLLSDIRWLQNQNSKIGPKYSYTSQLPCFYLFLEKKINNNCRLEKYWSSQSRVSAFISTSVVEKSTNIQHIETLERINFWGKWHFFRWFSMVQDRFSKIKTNFENFFKIWKMLNFEAVWCRTTNSQL